jgi:hypothetical protein
MPRLYRVPFTGTLTNAGGDSDLVSLLPADDKPIRLVGWILGQTTEIGDAAEESIRFTVRHMTATVSIGSGGSAVTPVANRPGTTDIVAAGFTARCNDTTVSTTSGTSVIMEELAWNIRSSPFERWIPEELRPYAAQGEALIVRSESTVTDDITVALTFLVEEL